eukprot:6456289-Amphidinium_carterae.1
MHIIVAMLQITKTELQAKERHCFHSDHLLRHCRLQCIEGLRAWSWEKATLSFVIVALLEILYFFIKWTSG